VIFKKAAPSLEPGDTQSILASHKAPNYVQPSKLSRNMVEMTTKFKLPEPDLDRTGPGK